MEQRIRVVVVGGGYAGVTAANRLAGGPDVDVTLVNPRPVFVERIRLHQLVGGSDDAVVEFGEVLADGVHLVVAAVDRIDVAGHRAVLGSGSALEYDYLVYAPGSDGRATDVPGAAEFAHPIAELADAERLRELIDASRPQAAPVVVVGSGPAGIETAAELAEAGSRVTLFCGGMLGPYLHPRGRRVVASRLERLGVTIVDGPGSRVIAVRDGAVELADGRSIPSAVTIWTTGFGVPDLAARSGLTVDAVGRLLTDETLTSIDDHRIVAAGDSAAPSGVPLRMSCQAAGPLGGHAADTILARIAGADPGPFVMGFFGQCISLGRRTGIFQFAHKDDTAIAFHVSGRAGAALKAIVCWGTVAQLRIEARHPGRLRLPKSFADPSRSNKLAAAEQGVLG